MARRHRGAREYAHQLALVFRIETKVDGFAMEAVILAGPGLTAGDAIGKTGAVSF
jgi:hypothetical protein